jgi:hypothetical protein
MGCAAPVWTEPPPLKRRSPAPGGTGNGAGFVSSSADTFTAPDDAAQPACAVATPDTANLQSMPRLTIKQAAKLMNVSERLVYMCKRVRRLRPDLYERIERGELSVNAAMRIVDGTKPQDRFAALCRAWNRASDDEQARFLVILGDAIKALSR